MGDHFFFLAVCRVVFFEVCRLRWCDRRQTAVAGLSAEAFTSAEDLSVGEGLSAGLSTDCSPEDCVVHASAKPAANTRARPQGDTIKRRTMERILSG